MIAVGISMLRRRATEGDPGIRIDRQIAVRLVAIGFITGLFAGFFGIGGGFLIVPGIMLGSGVAVLNAIGSSLFSVGAFGLRAVVRLAARRGAVTRIFSGMLFAVAVHMLYRSSRALGML